jgi:hypothetical protein
MELLFYFGEAARPDLCSLVLLFKCMHTDINILLLSSHTTCCLNCRRGVAVSSPVAKSVRIGPTFPPQCGSSTGNGLAACYPTAPRKPRDLNLTFLHTKLLQNGRPNSIRTRCAPIHVCCREATITLCVPAMGATRSSEATAILGICRSYAYLKQLKLCDSWLILRRQ